MSGRGIRGNPPLIPPSPTDPTLESWPVPRERRFPIRSSGPGTAADIQQTCVSLEQIDHVAQDNPIPSDDPWAELYTGAHRALLHSVTKWENMSFREDDYTDAVKDKLPGAIEKLIRAQQRKLHADSVIADPYAKELYRRLRFDVVEDQEALEGASVDRVRECFCALVRTFELSDDENIYPPPARNMVCLVVDGGKVEMLANLEFFDDYMDELRAHQQCKLQAVNVRWKRPEMTRDNYCGA